MAMMSCWSFNRIKKERNRNMSIQDCIRFASENPVCFMATMDGDQPRVRTLLMFFADENGFYFCTLTPKAFTKQLKENPKVEVCFYNNPPELQGAKQMRVTGQAEFIDDQALIDRVAKERAFLEPLAGRSLADL